MSETLHEIYGAVINFERDRVIKLVNMAISEKIDPMDIFDQLNSAVRTIGDKFGKGELFLTDLVASADAMKAGVEIIEPLILESKKETKSLGKVALATAEGDIHDIGKNIVITMLRAAGFNVLDWGVDTPIDKIVESFRKEKPQIIGISALLTSTIYAQEKLIKKFRDEGIRDDVKIIVGGAPVTKEWAEEIGADGYAPDGFSAVNLVKQLLNSK